MYGNPVFWRETMKPGKFLIFEGRVVFILLFSFIHLRIWTIMLTIVTLAFFWYFERKGVSANAIARFLKAKIIGRKRTARGVYEERTAVDFSFECQEYLVYLANENNSKEKTGSKFKGFLEFKKTSSNDKSKTLTKKSIT